MEVPLSHHARWPFHSREGSVCQTVWSICYTSSTLWVFPSVSLSAAATVAVNKPKPWHTSMTSNLPSALQPQRSRWRGSVVTQSSGIICFGLLESGVGCEILLPSKPPRASWNQTQLDRAWGSPPGSSPLSSLLLQSDADGKLRHGRDTFLLRLEPQRRRGQNICVHLWVCISLLTTKADINSSFQTIHLFVYQPSWDFWNVIFH